MGDQAREAWAAARAHPLLAVAATLASLLLSLAAWNGARALAAIDKQTDAIEALDRQTQISIGSLRDDLGSVRTDIARMQTLYQTQVPDIVQRVAEAEKAIRLLRWEAEMLDYRADKEIERAARRRPPVNARAPGAGR